MAHKMAVLWMQALFLAARCVAAQAAPARFAEVAITGPEGRTWRQRVVPGEWLSPLADPELKLPYRGGSRLRFEWHAPRLFCRVDDGPRCLVAIRADQPGGTAALREAIAEGVGPLLVWCRGVSVPRLPPVPANLDLGLCAHSWKVQDVSALPARFPGLTALYLASPPVGPPARVVAELARLGRLTSLHVPFGNALFPDLGPLARLKRLAVLEVAWTRQIHVQPFRPRWLPAARPPPGRHADLAPLAAMTQLQSLSLRGEISTGDLTPLSKLQALVALKIGARESDCGRVSDLTPLAELPNLRRLELSGCSTLTDLRPLTRLPRLEELHLDGCENLTDIAPLTGLRALRSLHLEHCSKVADITPLAGMTRLAELRLSNCYRVRDISPLANLTNLTRLSVRGFIRLADIAPLARLRSLRRLDLSRNASLADLAPLAALAELTDLAVGHCGTLSDLRPLARLPKLTDLSLELCRNVRDLGPLATLGSLRMLDLNRCENVADLTPLAGLRNLRTLLLERCAKVEDITPVGKLLNLRILDLDGCDRIPDLTALGRLPHLSEIGLRGCDGVTDITPLRHALKRGARIRVTHRLGAQLQKLRRRSDF